MTALRISLPPRAWRWECTSGVLTIRPLIDVTLGLAQNEGRLPAPGSAGAGALMVPRRSRWSSSPSACTRAPLNEGDLPYLPCAVRSFGVAEGVRNFVAIFPTGTDILLPIRRCSVLPSRSVTWTCPRSSSGAKDPVFQRRYLFDLMERMPQAKVHRYEKASHLVIEDYDIASP